MEEPHQCSAVQSGCFGDGLLFEFTRSCYGSRKHQTALPHPEEKTTHKPFTFFLWFLQAIRWLFLQLKGSVGVFRHLGSALRLNFWLVQLLHHRLRYGDHHGSGGCVADPHGQEGCHYHETHQESEMRRVGSELSPAVLFWFFFFSIFFGNKDSATNAGFGKCSAIPTQHFLPPWFTLWATQLRFNIDFCFSTSFLTFLWIRKWKLVAWSKQFIQSDPAYSTSYWGRHFSITR